MEISNKNQLRAAVRKAGDLLQSVQEFVGRDLQPAAKVRFPRGYLRTASDHRVQLRFVSDSVLKSNLAYTFILSDVILWLLLRTDVGATAREMLVKLQLFLGGTMVESITKEYLRGLCGKGYEKRCEYLVSEGVIEDELREELNWLWNMRNNMHLFLLERPEYDTKYDDAALRRSAAAFNGLLQQLNARGRLTA